MGKKLAIKGHVTRGKEVIELLEMMGGKNIHNLSGNDIYSYYIIKGFKNEIRDELHIFGDENMQCFTLEEFLEKFPFKVGDFVRIPEYESEVRIFKMKWCPLSEHIEYLVCPNDENEWFTVNELLEDNDNPINKRPKNDVLFDSIIWHLRNSINNGKQNLSGGECEHYFREVVKKNNENKMKNVLAELLEHIKTTPKEELEKEFKEIEEWSYIGSTVEEFMTFCESVNKKTVYPKTYDECCKVLDFCGDYFLTTYEPDCMVKKEVYGILQQVNSLTQLLICKSAYWKIAGEEMGLGKPWEPDWSSFSDGSYPTITKCNDRIIKTSIYTHDCILAFPTQELRDIFYDNFKELIENCKELL